jgi:serine/threonine-protein kinase RsbT
MEDGYSTGGGLGGGLPAVRRLMDELVITSDPAGTRVVARKWLPETYPR